ncbi:hypothetical protein C6A85_86245 [Mycobacterium sp. ITM-2017-0098]|nr:hypothetical protein C6A85_86245 [Mycobacterium sp. ITM-2017-0098]
MRANRRYTSRPFTVAVCVACTPEVADSVVSELRRVIRNCPHAVLVVTQCLLGKFACAAKGPERGVMLMLQPCAVDRVPLSSMQLVGPLRSKTDAEAACAWIAAGVWDSVGLPSSLQADMNLSRSSRLN